jgi:hypothetical protein
LATSLVQPFAWPNGAADDRSSEIVRDRAAQPAAGAALGAALDDVMRFDRRSSVFNGNRLGCYGSGIRREDA